MTGGTGGQEHGHQRGHSLWPRTVPKGPLLPPLTPRCPGRPAPQDPSRPQARGRNCGTNTPRPGNAGHGTVFSQTHFAPAWVGPRAHSVSQPVGRSASPLTRDMKGVTCVTEIDLSGTNGQTLPCPETKASHCAQKSLPRGQRGRPETAASDPGVSLTEAARRAGVTDRGPGDRPQP